MEHVIEPGTVETGIVYVQNNCIFYEPKSGRKTKISIAIDDIVLIGEYAINNYPLNKNHWFMVFVSKKGSWKTIPWFTEGMQQLSVYLAYHFKTGFALSDLTMTIREKSLIRYPYALQGKPVFRATPPKGYKIPLTVWQKIKSFLRLGSYGKKWQLELTDEVKDFLKTF
jgi:hypothetical protein